MKPLHFAKGATGAQRDLAICPKSHSTLTEGLTLSLLTSGLSSLGKQLLARPQVRILARAEGPETPASSLENCPRTTQQCFYSPEADAQPKQDQRTISNLQVTVRGISTTCLTDQSIEMAPTLGCSPQEKARCCLGGWDHRGGSKMVLRDQVASLEHAFH